MAARSVPVQEFEAKCAELQRGSDAASKWLEALKSQQHALQVAKDVLQTSPDMLAQFHAAQTLCDVVVTRWNVTAADQRQGIRTHLLGLVFERWESLHHSVRNKLLQVVAVFWKRGWLEETAEAKLGFLKQIQSLLQSSGGTQLMGIHLVSELLQQFSATKSATISMPLQFHRSCREAFKSDGLRQLWSLAFQVVTVQARAFEGQSTLASAAASAELTDAGSAHLLNAASTELLSVALAVMFDCLEWKFDRASASTAGSKCPLVTPGADWRTILLDKSVTDTLFSLYGSIRCFMSTPLPHRTREAILQMCCLSGDVFPDDGARTEYFARIAVGVLSVAEHGLTRHFASVPLTTLATTAGKVADEINSEALFVAQGIYRLIDNFKPRVFGALPHETFKSTLEKINAVTQRLLTDAAAAAQSQLQAAQGKFGQLSSAVGDLLASKGEALLEAFDFVLEAWVSMLTAPEVESASDAVPAVKLMRECCGGLFATLVKRRLEIATAVVSAGIDDDDPYEDPEKLDMHLQCAAVLARASPRSSVVLLSTLIANDTAQVRQAAAASAAAGAEYEMAVACLNERLLWLSWFAGHVLADDGGGETPQVPDSINKLSTSLATHASAATRSHKFATSAAAVAADPVVALCSNMFHLVKTQTTLLQNNPHSPLLSPLTVKTLLWYLQRWSRTYLLPNMSEYRRSTLSPNLTRLYGTIHSKDRPGFSDGSGAGSEAVAQLGLSSGDAVAEFVAQTSTLALALWPSEPGCAGQALSALQSLVANRSVSSVLLTSPTWQALVRASAVVVAGEGATSPAAAALGPLRGLTGLVTDDQRRLVALLVGATKGARLGDDDSLAFGSDGNSNTMSQLQALSSKRMQDYFTSVAGPVLTKLRTMLSQACFSSIPYPAAAKTPQVEAEVRRIVNLCQGATCPAFVVDPNWLLPVALPMLEKCSHLIRGYGAGHTVTVAALAFTRAFLKAQLPVLQPAPSQQVYRATAQVLAAYAEQHNGTRPSGSAESELRDDLMALLEMISSMVVKDGLDWGDGSTGEVGAAGGHGGSAAQQVHVIDVALYGLTMVVKLVSDRLLGYPDLCSLYVRVVSELFDQYPEKIAVQDSSLLAKLLAVLTHALAQPNAANQRVALEALYSIAEFHATALRKSGGAGPTVGLCSHLSKAPTLLMTFAQQILGLLLSTSCPDSSVDPASNALLAILVGDQQAFYAMANAFVSQQRTAETQKRLRDAFGMLTTHGGLRLTNRPFLRPNRNVFMANVRSFVQDVRSFVVIK